MEKLNTSLLVIGAGPGGYVCAIRAGQLGIDTVVVESGAMGGTCLNVGCIPSKAIIHATDEFHRLVHFSSNKPSASSMGISTSAPSLDLSQTIQWKDGIVKQLNAGVSGLLKKANVRVLAGQARFTDGKTIVVTGKDGETQLQCENIVVAAGSEPVEIPTLPFGEHVLSSTDLLAQTEVPTSLVVVGGGYIGLELGTSMAKAGSQVTVVESAERVLSQYDAELTEPVAKRLQDLGIEVLTSTQADTYNDADRALQVNTSDGQTRNLKADKVLVTVGRKPQLSGWGLDELQLTSEAGHIVVDHVCQTSMRGVFAIGDVTGEPMLAHRAMAQGELVAKHLSGESVVWDKQCIPAVCFTDPEIVTAGLSPDEAEASNLPFSVSHFPFKANGRAMSLQREDGFIRVVTDTNNNTVLGIQAVGAGVSELSSAFSLAIEMCARAEDIAATVHAHPTLSEAFQEACMKAAGHGLHM